MRDSNLMKICNSCNAENPEEAKFCRSCGTPLSQELSTPSTSPTPSAIPAPEVSATPSVDNSASYNVAEQLSANPNISTTSVNQTSRTESQSEPARYIPSSQTAGGPQAYGQQYPLNGQIPQGAVPTQFAAPAQQPPLAQAPTATQPNAFTLLMRWLWDSFKRPSEVRKIPVWWAIVPIALNAVLVGATTFSMISHQYSSVSSLTSGINSFLSDIDSSYSVASSVPVSELFKTAFLVFAFLYVVVAMTFAGIKLLGDRSITFSQLHDELGQKLTPLLAVNCCALVTALLGMNAFAIVLMMVATLFILIIPTVRIAQTKNQRKLDSTWMWGFATLLVGVVLVIVIFIILLAGAAEILSAIF
jgi:hypothetical protein